jgi:hypothetical protein
MSDADSTQLESRGSGPAQIPNKLKGPFRKPVHKGVADIA